MRVTFRVNLGSVDAQRHGLDFRQCTAGQSIECGKEAAEWLITRGIAEESAVQAIARPAELEAVPPSKPGPVSTKAKFDKYSHKEE